MFSTKYQDNVRRRRDEGADVELGELFNSQPPSTDAGNSVTPSFLGPVTPRPPGDPALRCPEVAARGVEIPIFPLGGTNKKTGLRC